MTEEEILSTKEITDAVFSLLTALQASSRQGRVMAIAMLAAIANLQPSTHARLAMRNDIVRDPDLAIAQFPSGGAA